MFNNEEAEFQALSEPLIQWQKAEAKDHECVVEEICEQIKQEMLNSNVTEFHLAWASVESDGTVKTVTATDRNNIININTTETQMSPEGGVKLFDRLSRQLFISANYIGHSDFPMVEIEIGCDDSENTAMINFPSGVK